MKGSVKFFNAQKGWGYITPDDRELPDTFVHFSEILGAGFRTLEQDDRVEFTIVRNEKGLRAQGVIIIQPAPRPLHRPHRRGELQHGHD